jgi:hypothetical protein
MLIYGRKSRGSSIGKKSSNLRKGVKGLGLALVAGAGIYAATHSADKEHKNTEEELSQTQILDIQREKLEAEGAKPAPDPVVKFGEAGRGGKLDKVEDILAVAGAGIEAARDVDEAEGKFQKAKAVVGGIKDVKDKAKEVGAKDLQAKFEAGLLTDQQAKKFVSKQQKQVEGIKRKDDCDIKYPPGSGVKIAAKNKACKKGLVKQV